MVYSPSYLNSRVAPIGDNNVVIPVHGQTGRRIELAITFAVGPESKLRDAL